MPIASSIAAYQTLREKPKFCVCPRCGKRRAQGLRACYNITCPRCQVPMIPEKKR